MAGRLGAGVVAAPWLGGCIRRPVRAGAGPAPVNVSGAESLKAHASARGVMYGCAVATELLGKDEAYERLVREQASIVVAENAMKVGPMRPAVDRFNFDGGDKLVAFAEANGMKVRGHNLCWHRQLPRWFDGYATKDNARALLTEHITTVAGRYAGKIHSWDVVNEAVLPSDGRADGLRESPWLKLMGPDYLAIAYETARAADGNALLTYNDYGIEGEDSASAKKREAVLELVRGLKEKGLVDAVGVQSHVSAGGSYGAGLADFLRTVAAMELQIYLTEMDVNDRKLGPDAALRDAAVAKTYREYLELAVREPAVKAVLTWGITDAHTWLNGEDAREDHLPERCLPFDRELRPVEAFWAMRGAFDGPRG